MVSPSLLKRVKPKSPSSIPILFSFSTNTTRKMVAPVVVQSVTNQEIARYWKHKQMLEEDHFYAAIKAAARIRARNLSDEDYLHFEDSLEEGDDGKEIENCSKERRVGIKDWWTKSKYAYLNQPAMKLVDNPRRRFYNYRPQFFSCKPASPLNSKPWISWAS